MKIIIFIFLLSNFSINFAIEISSYITAYGVLNESVILKVNKDYFSKEYNHDLETVRKIQWVNNHGAEILTYNTQTKEVLMKNYTERIRFNQEKSHLIIENIRSSDCGGWRLYLQNSNADTRLYILTFELEIFKEIEISLKSSHEINNSSKIAVQCKTDYRDYNNKCKIPSLHNINLVTSSENINQILLKEKSSIDDQSLLFNNEWSFIVQSGNMINDLSFFCSIKTSNSTTDTENKIEIKSKTLTLKAPVITDSLQKIIFYKNYNLNYVNESFSISCGSTFPNSKHLIFEGILKETDMINSTNSIDYLVSFMSKRLKHLDQRNLNKAINYTCLEYEDSSMTKEYLILTYTITNESFNFNNIQAKLQKSSLKDTCNNCGTIITSTICALLVIAVIIVAYVVKYSKNKKNKANYMTPENKFYEELNIQFEQSSLKHKTEGNELKIYLA